MLRGAALVLCAQTLALLITIGYAGAMAMNRTIDDEFGDSITGQKPIFLPTTPGIWDGEECVGCRVQPDRAVAFKGTWNAATFRHEVPGGSGDISIDLSFKGTAIYVYFITGNQIAGGIITTLTECNFTLDGQYADFFQHIPDQTTNMNYNVLAFSRTNLENIDHTLRVSTGGVNYHVFVNFDYAIYTFDDGEEPTVPSLPRTTSATVPPTFSKVSSPSGSSSATSEIPPSTPGNSPTILERSTSPGGFTTSTGNFGATSQNTPTVTPVAKETSVPSNERRVPLVMILGATIGGLTLVFALIFLFWVYRIIKKRQKRVHLASPVGTPTQQVPTVGLQGETSQDLRSFAFHKQNPSTPNNTSMLSRQYDVKVRRRASGTDSPDVTHHVFANSTLGTGSSGVGSDVGPPGASSSLAAVVDDALRAQQLDLDRRLLFTERGPRELGAPRRGPLGSNVLPAAIHTAAHIEYRHTQGGPEGPPPQYSED